MKTFYVSDYAAPENKLIHWAILQVESVGQVPEQLREEFKSSGLAPRELFPISEWRVIELREPLVVWSARGSVVLNTPMEDVEVKTSPIAGA